MQQQNAKNRKLQPVCNVSMIHGGIMHDSNSCHYRHVILKDDVSSNSGIPANGLVRLKFEQFFSPTFYCVHLLEHYTDGKWITINRSNEYPQFSAKFKAHYETSDSLVLKSDVNIGDLCVYKEEKPYRAKVIETYKRKYVKHRVSSISYNQLFNAYKTNE